MSARKAIAFYLASAAYIHAEFPRLYPLPAFCHVHLHHARFSAVSFQREPPTHFGIVDRFKNIFHDNNSRDCEKLIPKRRRARPVECRYGRGISRKDFPGVTERSRIAPAARLHMHFEIVLRRYLRTSRYTSKPIVIENKLHYLFKNLNFKNIAIILKIFAIKKVLNHF